MIFTDDGVDLPDRVLESLTNDRLVVFVGAGVSMRAYKEQPPNTYYPGFKGLATAIAQRLYRPITETEQTCINNGDIDRVLGEWDDKKCDVRSHAAAILQANEKAQRLDLHRAIIRLFASYPTPRIVTTNFDRLLIRALEAEGLGIGTGGKWNINIAPALTPVRRFRGICYLHGHVSEAQDMVLTDRDIGRAYMDEGWALRFAHSIFQLFDILFVGYRLEDPPLRYLSLALEGITERKRWALIPHEDGCKKDETERDWQRRHVEPIWYLAKDNDYRALERTIDAWGRDNSRSFLDRRNILVDHGKSKPHQLKPYELSRVKFFMQDPPSLRDFAKASLDIEWFDTLFSWGHLDFLVKGIGKWTEADRILTERFIDWIISNPVETLSKVAEHRATLHTDLFDQFCRSYQEGKTAGTDIGLLRRVLEFFRPVIERRRSLVIASIFMKRILAALLEAGYEDDAFWLLETALRTESAIKKGTNFAFLAAKSEGTSTESIPEYTLQYELRFEDQHTEHSASEVFKDVFLPRIASIGFKLAHFLTLKFIEIRALDSRGQTSKSRSHLSWPAIETHPQNFSNDPVNFLLDLLRDCWEELLKVNRTQAEAIYWFWDSLNDDLIERLRLHALTKLVEAEK